MDGASAPAAQAELTHVVASFDVSADQPDWCETLLRGLGKGPFAFVALFVSPTADFSGVMRTMSERLSGATIVGCTTAGEIGRLGYTTDSIVAFGCHADYFSAVTQIVEDVTDLDRQSLISEIVRKRTHLSAARPHLPHEFAFLLVDGLSLAEDPLASACADALGPVPIFGGSAGDGTSFRQTAVAVGDRILPSGAALTYIRTSCPVSVFSLDHLKPSDQRLVVTSADPKQRLVAEINAEPAAREYARILGKDPEQLDAFTFAAHPLVVRFGGRHHVRSIQRVTPKGELIFFSAIEEGVVLSLARADALDTHLNTELAALSKDRMPLGIMACDCILRRLEAEQKQLGRAISRHLSQHKVVGFSTYGEQFGGIHLNQTMTGVAIYPPEDTAP